MPTDAEVQKKFGEELAKEAKNSNASLIAEIKKLSEATLSVEGSFFNIQKSFERVLTSSDISEDLKSTVTDLKTTWSGHKRTFSDLLWKSRDVAGVAEDDVKDFQENIITWLKRDDQSVVSKRKGLSSLIMRMEEKAKRYTDLADAFDQLKKAVAVFQEKWADVVQREKGRIDQKAKKDLDKINKDLVELQGKLKTKTDELNETTKKYGTIGTVVSVGHKASNIFEFLGNLLPISYIGIITKVFSTLLNIFGNVAIPDLKPFSDKVKALQDEVAKKTEEKNGYVPKDKNAFNLLAQELEASKDDFINIADKVSLFSGVWSMIAGEMKQILEALNEVSDANIKESAFYEKLEGIQQLYKGLKDVLEQYQISVIPQGEKP